MTPLVEKITQQYNADNDMLEQVLGQASRAYEKAFLFDRFTDFTMEGIDDFSCNDALQEEQLDCELSPGIQVSEQLFNLMQELKHCHLSTIGEKYVDVSNGDVLHDLKFQMQQDVWNMPHLLAAQDEGEPLEQALECAARRYQMSFALDRLVPDDASDRLVPDDVHADDAELFFDCIDFNSDQDRIEMHMPTIPMSDMLFDMVQDLKNVQLKETEDLDDLCLGTPNFEAELELSMLEDMSKISHGPDVEREIASKALAPHPKQLASVRNKAVVTCSLPLACFANARVSCGGVPCGSPKKVTASPANAAWRASPASAAWRSHRV